jgi:hypothetical protein
MTAGEAIVALLAVLVGLLLIIPTEHRGDD